MEEKRKNCVAHKTEVENSINNNTRNNCMDRGQCGSDGECEDDHYSGISEPFELTNLESPSNSSLFMSDVNAGLTSDTDSGVHRDETATPKSNEASSDEDKSHPLMRRDTFDLLDMVSSGDEDRNSTTVKDDIEIESPVVWAIGDDDIKKSDNECFTSPPLKKMCETTPVDTNSLEIIKNDDTNDEFIEIDKEALKTSPEIDLMIEPQVDGTICLDDVKGAECGIPGKYCGNIFSPDSIVSEKSPILHEEFQKEGGIFQFQRKMSSRKSSASQSPEADSLNIESVPFTNLISLEEKGENIEIVSQFAEEPAEDSDEDDEKGQGSFFVFIDMNKLGEPKPDEPKICRRRAISFTAGEENLMMGEISDATKIESLSDEEQSAPKCSTSVYMYIDAASSDSRDSTLSRKPQSKKTPRQEPPGKTRHLRTHSLGQELRLNISTSTPEPPRAKDDMKLHDLLRGNDDDDVNSEFSESALDRSSSVLSPDGTDDSDRRGPCSKLGDDLLTMFLDEINTDVVINVNGRDIKAHKCILSSRCSYFAAMLSGGWLESSGNVINLQGFSFTAVHFALCHIYCGATSIPKEADILELASLADMLGLEGLKDVVALTLKAKYCHFFHKPCATCINGVMECLTLCANYGLEELYDKSLRWITKYMACTWPTKPFATLPSDLINKCYLAATAEITVDTVLDTIMICDKLMTTLPHVKWSEPVFGLSSKLLEACTVFMARNFHAVLTSKNFLDLGKGQSWNVNALEDTIMVALDSLTPDSACLSYATLDELLGCGESCLIDPETIENFIELLHKIQRRVERYLIHNANRVVQSPSWAKLSPTTQKRIKDAAVIVFEFGKPTAPPPRLSSLNRRFHRGKPHSPVDRSESSTTSSSSGRLTGSKRQVRSLTNKLTLTRPITAPTPQNSKSTPSQKKASATGTDLKNSTLKRSASITDNATEATPKSKPSVPNRNTDVGIAKLRKTNVRDRLTSNARPKSWPNKEKAQHPVKTQNKENSKETRLSATTTTSRPNSKASVSTRSSSGSMSRPKSANYTTDPEVDVVRPTRSATTSALRETKSSSSKKVPHVEPEKVTPKAKVQEAKTTRHAVSSARKGKEDKHQKPHTKTVGEAFSKGRQGVAVVRQFKDEAQKPDPTKQGIRMSSAQQQQQQQQQQQASSSESKTDFNKSIPIDDYEYPYCDEVAKYDKMAKIGQGTFGEVFKAKHKKTKKLVALKKVLMDNEKEGFPITALREIRILQLLKHENVVNLIEISSQFNRSKSTFYLVFDFCEHDLAGLLSNVNVKFSLGEIKKVMQQLLNGLYFIHSNKILHRDMKAANILITKSGVLKLADFGLARAFSVNKNGAANRYTNRVVTLWYRPPELLLGERNYGPSVDQWGAGCIMAEMWTRSPIMQGGTEQHQVTLISQLCGSISPEAWPGVEKLELYNKLELPKGQKRKVKERLKAYVKDQFALDLLDKLLILDPKKRVDSDSALNHDFFWTDPMPGDLARMLSTHTQSMFEFLAPRRRAPQPHAAAPPNAGRPPTSATTEGQYHDRVF
uniref:Protein kinase domain-containing protein n=1 Tax=Strigamia maritima TaxID=126957 RepID=T1IY59_STRMM